MTTGFSGTYAVNGVDFILPPTTGKWRQRDEAGIDGNGHPIYPAVRDFELTWGLAHPTDVKQFTDAYNNSVTGTCSFDLPLYGDADYQFYRYTGITMVEPEMGSYFQGWVTDVKLTLLNVRT